jgi:AcrR family transcriptional regulator
VTQRPVRRRRRDEELLQEIRDAVRAELQDHGYAGVTFEGVARRVGTSKSVLYRRYGSRAEMVLDALRFEAEPLPTTLEGPLAVDLVELMEMLARRTGREGGRTILGMVAELDDDTVASATTSLFEVLEGWLRLIIETARTRGELGPEPVPPRVLTSVVSLIRGELLFAHGVRRPADLRGLADQVVVPLLQASTGSGTWPGPR